MKSLINWETPICYPKKLGEAELVLELADHKFLVKVLLEFSLEM